MLAVAEGDIQGRCGERVFADLLPAGDWRLLADRLDSAHGDGLAHGFDTKWRSCERALSSDWRLA